MCGRGRHWWDLCLRLCLWVYIIVYVPHCHMCTVRGMLQQRQRQAKKTIYQDKLTYRMTEKICEMAGDLCASS